MNVRTIRPVKGLKGEVTIPGDKSISHRSIMLGSIALGTTEITHFLEGADCLSTIDCFRRMGVEIERKPSCILVHGKGLRGLSAPASTLNVGNSGTTTRLISGILSGQNFAINIIRRCFSEFQTNETYYDTFKQHGGSHHQSA